jgi:hypothetical protein
VITVSEQAALAAPANGIIVKFLTNENVKSAYVATEDGKFGRT